jgi:hypothetical protein
MRSRLLAIRERRSVSATALMPLLAWLMAPACVPSRAGMSRGTPRQPSPKIDARSTVLGLVLVGLLATHGEAIAPGVWGIRGTDAELGRYAGTLEIREGEGGSLEAIRLVQLADLTHTDGRAIDLVWTGAVTSATVSGATLSFALTRADFITQVGRLVRTAADATPLGVTATLRESEERAIDLAYTAPARPSFGIAEIGAFVGPPAAEPIWRSGRVVQETHEETPEARKRSLFTLFASYHALPAVQPYVTDPRFQRAMHFQVVERTDFDYYRAHPDRLRVVNKVVDAISLAETEVRANAFRARFAEKAAFYQEGLTQRLVGSHGMVVASLNPAGEEFPDGDSALWTGVYTYTQALRFQATGEAEALDNLRRSLQGILTLLDITGDPHTFARTLRLTGPPLTGNWRRGTGAFAPLDWLAGGNNDMAQGLVLGIIAGWEALPRGDPLRAPLPPHARALLALCQFQRAPSPACGGDNAELDLPSVNPGTAELLAGITNQDPALILNGLAWFHQPALLGYAAEGAGPFYVDGISDWSGNHLTLATAVAIQWLLGHTADRALAALWVHASGEAWKVLRRLEPPLHAALAAGLRALEAPQELAEATDQALWGLRSFPLPKHPYPVDHRLRADFVLSPYPAVPWKGDWLTNPGRQQALVAYGMLEHALDQYRWNDNAFSIAQTLDQREVPGVDYLFLYWLARDTGMITAQD